MNRAPTLPEIPVPASAQPPLRLRFGMLSDPGRARERNEDACAVFVPWEDGSGSGGGDSLFLVADGMGGHDAGDLASAFVAERVRAWFTQEEGAPRTADDLDRALKEVLLEANTGLLALARERAVSRGMGSTATVACFRGDTLHVAHVGDSRLYRLREGELEVITDDHSWVGEQQRAGLLTEEEAEHHPRKHMLTECLGVGSDVRIDLLRSEVRQGDRYLLCSDGLHGPVPRPDIVRTLAGAGDPQQTARTLVALANEREGPDNVTVLVIHVEPPAPPGALHDAAGPEGEAVHEADEFAVGTPSVGAPRPVAWSRGLAILGGLVLVGAAWGTFHMAASGNTPVDPQQPADARTQAEDPEPAAGPETPATPPEPDSMLASPPDPESEPPLPQTSDPNPETPPAGRES